MRSALAASGLVIAVGVAIAAVPPPPALVANPEVRVIHVNAPNPATGSITLANTTGDAVTVTQITRDPSCDAEVTHGLTTPTTIAGNGTLAVPITCAGTFTSGMRRCIFHATPAVHFEAVCEGGVAGNLVPAIDELDFGSVVVGGEARQSLTLTNTSGSTITRLSLQTTDFAGNFELAAPCNPDARECDVAIASVGPGATTSVTVACRPESVGTHAAQLRIATDSGQVLSTPVTLLCTGTASPTPVLALSGDPVDAGRVEVTTGNAQPMRLRLRNAGTGNLQLAGALLVDGGNGAKADWSYTTSGECPAVSACTLEPEEILDLQLTFDPSALGSRDATLVITYFDIAARSRSIPLDGVGIGATLAALATPLELEFGNVPVNITSDLPLVLANGGNREVMAMLAVEPTSSPFSLVPAASIPVAPGMPVTVTASCRPTAVGPTDASLLVTATDTLAPTMIDVVARCTGTSSLLYAVPSGLMLGQVRTATARTTMVQLQVASGPQLQITSAVLATADPDITITGAPGMTPLPLQLMFGHTADATLDNELIVSASNGTTLRIPITGKVVSASYQQPVARSLGTFCVNQPTTPEALVFRSTGTATVELAAPEMALGAMSPFDLSLQAPDAYPTLLDASATARIEITPRRQAAASVQQDDIVWTTDVEGMEQVRTPISARFVDDGGAIAPDALSFGPSTIHLEQPNAQRVTLQNCDTQTIMLAEPDVPAPFRIDSPNFPSELAPNETATFSVGFHPTRVGFFEGTLRIFSQQLEQPLEVTLSGEGARPTLPPDAGGDPGGVDDRSFYGCDCRTSSPRSSAALALLLLVVLRRRRR